jgi:hypothetical protein
MSRIFDSIFKRNSAVKLLGIKKLFTTASLAVDLLVISDAAGAIVLEWISRFRSAYDFASLAFRGAAAWSGCSNTVDAISSDIESMEAFLGLRGKVCFAEFIMGWLQMTILTRSVFGHDSGFPNWTTGLTSSLERRP